MLTRKPLTITVLATHHRCDGLAGSSNPPARAPDCDRAVASGRAMSLPNLYGALFYGALFETVHHPAKAPAMEIDVLVHAVAVERLLLHKRPRRRHVRDVEEEHATYGSCAVVGYQWSTRHDHAGVCGEVRLVGRAELLTQG